MKRLLTAAGLLVLSAGSAGAGDRAPNYWCTWGTQGSQVKRSAEAGKIKFDGDQGGTIPQRNNINERVLFDADGWATAWWPNLRKDLYFLLDDGWDVPYGSNNDSDGIHVFGACVPDKARFPSLTGTPGERLRKLNDMMKARGWRGAALWVACQTPGEKAPWRPGGKPEDLLTLGQSREKWAERVRISKEAGIRYWKVDWGLHAADADYRAMMTAVKNEIYPQLKIEHCWSMKPLNGYWPEKDGAVAGNRRLFGDERWEKRRGDFEKILAASDVFRTYDIIGPFQESTTLERCAYFSELAESKSLPVLLNVEGDAVVGAALGHAIGIMSCYNADGQPTSYDVALAWQRFAAPFGHDRGIRTVHAEETLEDSWTYGANASWYTPINGKTVSQKAPAAVMRGLPLPEVKTDGEKPFVCGARFPDGAMAVAFLKRAFGGKREVTCPADVTLDAALGFGRPLALFGEFRSFTLKGGTGKGCRITARTLPDGKPRDVTALCTVGADGSLTIPFAVTEPTNGACVRNVVLEAEPRMRLVWNDEFDGPALDSAKWDYERGFVRNEEPQWYRPENASVKDGKLILEARRERVRNPNFRADDPSWQRNREYAEYTSASVNTYRKFMPLYGRIEVSAKIPEGISMWPAIWTLGGNINEVGWPKCGEIDIMEYWGVNPDDPQANIHYFTPESKRPNGHRSQGPYHCRRRKTTDGFHTYTLDWTADRFLFRFDGELYGQCELSKFDLPDGSNAFRRPQYLLLNLALTGKQGQKGDLPAEDAFPKRFEVDYVRIYSFE